MADQASYQIASDPVVKDKKPAAELKYEYTPEEKTEAELVQEMLQYKESYWKSRQAKEKEWTASYKMYMSYIDTTRNPFLSNLFIPKTHEAVESLSAFLIGTNQSIKAEPENNGDSYKATVAGKWLDYLWRKVISARLKVLTFIKQGIVFGNGVMKVGLDPDTKNPWINNTAIEDIYFDYFQPFMQDSEWIFHELRPSIRKAQDDETYDAKDASGQPVRNSLIEGTGSNPYLENAASLKFAAYDKTMIGEECKGRAGVLEGWCKTGNRIVTIGATTQGWRVLRNKENKTFKYADGTAFRPFVKLRFKTSPLANRAYDTGAIYPTVKIQKSFNDLINQYFDNVILINNPMWIKKKGARINPSELVRRPGGVISVPNIDDIKAESVGDVKSSVIEMLNRLDGEFQQASMVVNLLKGIDNGSANTATEATLGQQNVQTLLDMIDENIGDALSELGDMILAISLDNASGNKSIKMFESDNSIGVLEFDPKNIKGKYDIRISADRSAGTSKVVRQKQLLDFLKIVMSDQMILQKYPNLIEKTLTKWLEEAGFKDTEEFFDEQSAANQQQPALPGDGSTPGGVPAVNTLLTPGANMQSAMAPAIPKV